jgi:hypothetical protein
MESDYFEILSQVLTGSQNYADDKYADDIG